MEAHYSYWYGERRMLGKFVCRQAVGILWQIILATFLTITPASIIVNSELVSGGAL